MIPFLPLNGIRNHGKLFRLTYLGSDIRQIFALAFPINNVKHPGISDVLHFKLAAVKQLRTK